MSVARFQVKGDSAWGRDTVLYSHGRLVGRGLGCMLKVILLGFVAGLDLESERELV